MARMQGDWGTGRQTATAPKAGTRAPTAAEQQGAATFAQALGMFGVPGALPGAVKLLTGGTKTSGVLPTYTPPVTQTDPRVAEEQRINAERAAADNAAAAARAAATSAANNSARSGANSQKSALQKQIDANNAQIGANQGKLDSLTGLTDTGLAKVRDSNLAAIDQALTAILTNTRTHFDLGLADLQQNQRDNEAAEGDASFNNLANRAREKQDLVGQALSQGAGETDLLKTQLQALRNFAANQTDINRSFFDTRTSVNAAITDLNSGTQTNLMNAELDALGKKGGVFDDYYAAMADAYTQMDNLATNNYLLQGENDSAKDGMGIQDQLLSWLDSGKNADSWVQPAQAARTASTPSVFKGFADKAAEAAGSSWTSPGVSKETSEFKGGKTSDTTLTSSKLENSPTNTASTGTKVKRPEGATLRRW